MIAQILYLNSGSYDVLIVIYIYIIAAAAYCVRETGADRATMRLKCSPILQHENINPECIKPSSTSLFAATATVYIYD